ncbi:MAG TPA: TIGR03067 domain-containing protein [Fimbriiglobus sp.]|nr:TIGR03067 domain-containing protein [Fimbriiglobus sp.]
MRRLAAVLLVSLVGVTSAQDAATELKTLEGAYQVKALARGGVDAPAEVKDAIKSVQIKGGKLIVTIADEVNTAKLTVDPGKKPAHIDLLADDESEKGKTFSGIYNLEKGELTIVYVEGKERPKDFDAKGEGIMRLVLTRKEKDK